MAKIPGTHIPAELKNLAINGGMDFFQRNEGNTQTVSGSTTQVGAYTADMWQYTTGGSNGKSYTFARSTNVPSQAQSGYQSTYSLLFTNTVAGGFAANDYYEPLQYRMEGLDYVKIHAKMAVFGFWLNVSLAGTYSFALRNQSLNRSYVTTFAASVGWQFVTIPVQMDTSAGGTWNFDNTIGLIVDIGAICGATNQTSTLNAWQTGNFLSATTSTNYVASAGNTLAITQFSIVEGPLGFSATGFSRNGKDIQQEIALCQRYYEKSYDIGTAVGTNTPNGQVWTLAHATTTFLGMMAQFKVTKRSDPTFTAYNPVTGVANQAYNYSTSAALTIGYNNAGTQSAGFDSNQSVSGTQNVGAHWTAEAGL